jgi:hypothetical protein
MLDKNKGYERQESVMSEWERLPVIDFIIVGGRGKDVDPFCDGRL